MFHFFALLKMYTIFALSKLQLCAKIVRYFSCLCVLQYYSNCQKLIISMVHWEVSVRRWKLQTHKVFTILERSQTSDCSNHYATTPCSNFEKYDLTSKHQVKHLFAVQNTYHQTQCSPMISGTKFLQKQLQFLGLIQIPLKNFLLLSGQPFAMHNPRFFYQKKMGLGKSAES